MRPTRRPALVALMAPLIALFCPLGAQAQSELCENPAGYCGRGVSVECLSRVGAGAIPAAGADDLCGPQLQGYFDCVAKAAAECGGGATGASGGAPADGDSQATAIPVALPYTTRSIVGAPGKRHYYRFTLRTGCFSALMTENRTSIGFAVLTTSGDTLANKTSNSILGKRAGRRLEAALPPGEYLFEVRTRESQLYRIELIEKPSC